MVVLESHFRNGEANLPVCRDARQGIATISEMTFESRSSPTFAEKSINDRF